VIMCCFDYEGVLELGDLKTQSLEGIFRGEAYGKIKRMHESGEHCLGTIVSRVPWHMTTRFTICHECDQRNADKSDVMVYSSEHDLVERVTLTSTTYKLVGR